MSLEAWDLKTLTEAQRTQSLWLELSLGLSWICIQFSDRLNSSFRLNTLGCFSNSNFGHQIALRALVVDLALPWQIKTNLTIWRAKGRAWNKTPRTWINTQSLLSCDYFERGNLVSQLFTIHQVAFEAEFDGGGCFDFFQRISLSIQKKH